MKNKILIALFLAAGSLALASPPSISPLFTFQKTPFGDGRNGSLLLASDGNLYGTTFEGGDDGQGCFTNEFVCAGTVFKITPQGQFTLLHTFLYSRYWLHLSHDTRWRGFTAGGV